MTFTQFCKIHNCTPDEIKALGDYLILLKAQQIRKLVEAITYVQNSI